MISSKFVDNLISFVFPLFLSISSISVSPLSLPFTLPLSSFFLSHTCHLDSAHRCQNALDRGFERQWGEVMLQSKLFQPLPRYGITYLMILITEHLHLHLITPYLPILCYHFAVSCYAPVSEVTAMLPLWLTEALTCLSACVSLCLSLCLCLCLWLA